MDYSEMRTNNFARVVHGALLATCCFVGASLAWQIPGWQLAWAGGVVLGLPEGEVSFQWKNLHFLIKEIGFLLRNPDFRLKNVGLIMKCRIYFSSSPRLSPRRSASWSTVGRWKHDEFCIKNDESCIQNDGFCINNDELCIKNDDLFTNKGWIWY